MTTFCYLFSPISTCQSKWKPVTVPRNSVSFNRLNVKVQYVGCEDKNWNHSWGCEEIWCNVNVITHIKLTRTLGWTPLCFRHWQEHLWWPGLIWVILSPFVHHYSLHLVTSTVASHSRQDLSWVESRRKKPVAAVGQAQQQAIQCLPCTQMLSLASPCELLKNMLKLYLWERKLYLWTVSVAGKSFPDWFQVAIRPTSAI